MRYKLWNSSSGSKFAYDIPLREGVSMTVKILQLDNDGKAVGFETGKAARLSQSESARANRPSKKAAKAAKLTRMAREVRQLLKAGKPRSANTLASRLTARRH